MYWSSTYKARRASGLDLDPVKVDLSRKKGRDPGSGMCVSFGALAFYIKCASYFNSAMFLILRK